MVTVKFLFENNKPEDNHPVDIAGHPLREFATLHGVKIAPEVELHMLSVFLYSKLLFKG